MQQRMPSPNSQHVSTNFNSLEPLKPRGDWYAAVDKYIVENSPWTLGAKDDEQSRARLATVLYTSAEALRIVTALAHPVIPDSTAKIWAHSGSAISRN